MSILILSASNVSERFDIIIIGAGPAGMAAAEVTARHGATTLVLDEQPAPGGQIYRAIESMGSRQRPELGGAYFEGVIQAQSFRASNVNYLPGASVWHVSRDKTVAYTCNGSSSVVTAKQVIIATGAQERPMPIPGWTLPGVMTIGAAQILLKQSEIGIEDGIFAGTGPLFYLVVYQYLQAGIPVKAVIDLTPRGNYQRALAQLPGALPQISTLLKGWRWKREIRKSGVAFVTGVNDLRITGVAAVTGIDYQHNNQWKHIDSEHVLLHQGVVPGINISLAAGCASRWHEQQACWVIDVDAWYQSSIPGIIVTGDGASVAGGDASRYSGKLAALGALAQIEKLSNAERDSLAKPSQRALRAALRIRPFLDALYRPADSFRIPQADKTIVCRCEEITAGEIRQVVATGCVGPNQLKSFSRCGMGPCQGRFCGLTVSELIATMLNKPVGDVGYFRIRPPIKPLRLQELAELYKEPSR
jgi:thioredoxin reductase/bacterioferritin-associated ferredoxin